MTAVTKNRTYGKIAGYGHHIYTYRNDILAILQKKKLPHLKMYL
jgi:hypothetical protein